MTADTGSPWLVISQLPPPVHGSTVMTATLMRTMASLDEEVTLIDRRFSTDISQVGSASVGKVFRGVGLLARLALNVRGSRGCIFFVTNRPASFVVDWALSELLRISRRKTVNYVHTAGYRDLAARGRVWAWMVGRLLGQASTTVCLSESLVRDVAAWVAPGHVRVIPNAVSKPSPPPAPDLSAGFTHQVLFLSNLIAEKGADTFVDAAVALSTSLEGTRFVVAGAPTDESQLQEFRREVAEAGVESQVAFLGAVDQAQRDRLLRTSTMLVFPSRYKFEAQPLTIIEAMAHGVPVVAYDVGAIRDLIPHGEAGFVVDAQDFSVLLDAIERIVLDAGLRAELSDGAQRVYAERHSDHAYAQAWKAVLADVT